MDSIADLKTITTPIGRNLKPLGFSKPGTRKWYRRFPEVEQFVYIDRFRYEPKNRIYLCHNLTRFEVSVPPPSFEKFMGGISVEHRIPRSLPLMSALDQESPLSADQRGEIIDEAFQKYLTPYLEEITTEANLLRCYYEHFNDWHISLPRDVCEALRAEGVPIPWE